MSISTDFSAYDDLAMAQALHHSHLNFELHYFAQSRAHMAFPERLATLRERLVPHLGLTTGGAIGAQTALKLEDCPKLIDEWTEAARRVRQNIIVLCHGGPIATPEDASYILRNTTNINGFYGASSMERLPTEVALTARTREFKSIAF